MKRFSGGSIVMCSGEEIHDEKLYNTAKMEELVDDIKLDLISLSDSSHVTSDIKVLSTDLGMVNNHIKESAECFSDLISVPRKTDVFPLIEPSSIEHCDNISAPSNTQDITRATGIFDVKNEECVQSPITLCLEYDAINDIQTQPENTISDILAKKCISKHLSLSMQDLPKLSSFPLRSKSQSALNCGLSQSRSVLISKSTDSGLPRSTSCLSLSNSTRGYEHIQSKVKAYIKNIKDKNDYKQNKHIKNKNIDNTNICSNEFHNTPSHTVDGMMVTVEKLKQELQDKDDMLSKMQENYDELLVKYAAAANRVDKLRFKVLDPGAQTSDSEGEESNLFLLRSNNVSTLTSGKAKNILSRLKTVANSYGNDCDGTNSSSEGYYMKLSEVSEHCTKEGEQIQPFVLKENVILSPPIKLYSNSLTLNKSVQLLPCLNSKKTRSSDLLLHTQSSEQHSIQCEILETPVENSQSAGLNEPEFKQDEYLIPLKSAILNVPHENPFIKVKRWQDSLPPLSSIEPSNYESADCNTSSRIAYFQSPKILKLQTQKDKVISSGADSGYPASEIIDFSKKSKSFDTQTPDTKDSPHTNNNMKPELQRTLIKSSPNIPLPQLVSISSPAVGSMQSCSEELKTCSDKVVSHSNPTVFDGRGFLANELERIDTTDGNDANRVALIVSPPCECWMNQSKLTNSFVPVDNHSKHVSIQPTTQYIVSTPLVQQSIPCIVPPLQLHGLLKDETASDIQSSYTDSELTNEDDFLEISSLPQMDTTASSEIFSEGPKNEIMKDLGMVGVDRDNNSCKHSNVDAVSPGIHHQIINNHNVLCNKYCNDVKDWVPESTTTSTSYKSLKNIISAYSELSLLKSAKKHVQIHSRSNTFTTQRKNDALICKRCLNYEDNMSVTSQSSNISSSLEPEAFRKKVIGQRIRKTLFKFLRNCRAYRNCYECKNYLLLNHAFCLKTEKTDSTLKNQGHFQNKYCVLPPKYTKYNLKINNGYNNAANTHEIMKHSSFGDDVEESLGLQRRDSILDNEIMQLKSSETFMYYAEQGNAKLLQCLKHMEQHAHQLNTRSQDMIKVLSCQFDNY